MHSPADFIEVTPDLIDRETCATIVARMRASESLQPGRVGGGVHPELKRSRDLRISGDPQWAEVEQRLQRAVFAGLVAYLRRYPQVLISPLICPFLITVTTSEISKTSFNLCVIKSTVFPWLTR